MKKLFALLLAAVMICSLFAGCVVEDNPTDPVEVTKPQVTAPAPFKNTDKYPLTGDHKLSVAVSLEKADESYLFGLMEEATGIDMEYRLVSAEQAPLLFLDPESMPDIFFTSAGSFGLSVQQIQIYGKGDGNTEGLLINFMDYLDKMPNLAQAYYEHPDLFDGVMSAEGAVYQLPYYVATLTGIANEIMIRHDHMKAAGWDEYPETIDEFTEMLRDLKEHFGATDPKYIPLTPLLGDLMNYNADVSRYFFPSFGKDYEAGIHVGSEGKVIAGFTTEQFKRMVTYLHELMEEGLLDPDALTANYGLMQQFMNDGHTSVNTWLGDIPASAYPNNTPDYGCLEPLTSEWNTEKVWPKQSPAGKWGGMISKTCKDLDAALAYMDAFFAPYTNPLNEEGTIYNLTFWLGEEGVDWEWKEEGESYIVKDYSDRWDASHGYSGAPYIGDFQAMRLNSDGSIDPFPASVKSNLYPYAVPIVRQNNILLNDTETEDYQDAWADITSYVYQMWAEWLTGKTDIESTWDEYLSELEAMGLQDVIDIYQGAYERMQNR